MSSSRKKRQRAQGYQKDERTESNGRRTSPKSDEHHRNGRKTARQDGEDITTAIVHHIGKSEDPPGLRAEEDVLDRLMFPFKSPHFMKHIYRRHCLAILGSGSSRLKDIIQSYMHDLDISKLMHDSPSERIFAWLKPKCDGPNSKQRRLDSIALENADHALTCYEAGASLYFRAPQEMADDFVPLLSRAIGLEFGAFYQSPYVCMNTDEHNLAVENVADSQQKGEIETFVARCGHVTDWHFDFMENFTVQLQGSKRWYLKRGNLTHVIRGATPHYKPDDNVEQQVMLHRMQDESFEFSNPSSFFNSSRKDVECVVLHPGDVLYFPAGAWHRVECVSDSISINMSLVGSNWADVTASAVREHLWRHPIFRSLISVNEYCQQSVRSPSRISKKELWDVAKDDSQGRDDTARHLKRTRELLLKGCQDALQSMKEIMQPCVLLPRASLLPRMAAIDCSDDRMIQVLEELHGPHELSQCGWPTSLQIHPNLMIVSKQDTQPVSSTTESAESNGLSDEEEGDPEATPEGMVSYLAFLNMGNEEIQPMVRLVLHVASGPQVACMEVLRKRCSRTINQIDKSLIQAADIASALSMERASFQDLPESCRLLLTLLLHLDLVLERESNEG